MDEERAELLEVPLREGSDGSDSGQGSAGDRDGHSADGVSGWREGGHMLLDLLIDLLASVAFWYVLLVVPATDVQFYSALGVVILCMIMWRVYLVRCAAKDQLAADIPYTCACVQISGKELFLVATVHISPRAPRDVEAVINSTKPDITMIELDDERLDRMREVPLEEVRVAKREDLQPIKIKVPSTGAEMSIFAQRALWNAEDADDFVSGEVVFDETDAYGLGEGSGPRESGSHLALIRRGSPDGEFAPFALKAHNAFRAGASAVLVVNQDEKLPIGRIGGGTLTGDVRVAAQTCSCGFPPIPVLLLPKAEGEQLLQLCKAAGPSRGPVAEFTVRDDTYPRRTLCRRLCQSSGLLLSGIGILYGIIQFAGVEVGGEFSAAEAAATSRGIPCVCIDVDMNRFWGRLAAALAPTPRNLWSSATSWLAFPRLMLRCLFPPPGNVDVLGSTVLHAASFPLRTWLAFPLAGFLSSLVMTRVLEALGSVSEHGAEDLGAVRKQDRDQVQAFMMLAIELYMYPQIYDAVVASRDEAMYQSIVARSNEKQAKRLVVVVGAGHSNGILERVRTRGL
mmetsp:Transcript_31690/g.56924  ORF Transcript_31690/g.56924 Transcript_31690/m.56924 type:complete len:568 (+) Transcript_31690:49-1752(+)